jgi:hypothetical protein
MTIMVVQPTAFFHSGGDGGLSSAGADSIDRAGDDGVSGAGYGVSISYTSPYFAVGTPFEGGLFQCKLVLGSDFPTVPPKGAP